MNKHIIMIAGEVSGDLRGAGVAQVLKASHPSIKISGIGGSKMRQAGVDTFFDITDLAVIGFWEVVKHYPRLKKIFDQTIAKIKELQPDAVVLIDYPGFNLRLAKHIKAMGIKVIYYVSPQIWAWKENRITKIKRDIDRLMVLFKFEKDYYKNKHQMDVDFVGHSLIDEINITKSKKEICQELNLNENKPIIGLLPGSREKEIEKHLPLMLEAIQDLDAQAVIIKSKQIPSKFVEQHLKSNQAIISEDYSNSINAADACIVCSGTATLEVALLEKPMVVMYKTSTLSYWIFKLLLKIPYISLVNLISQEYMIQEFVQNEATTKNIKQAISPLVFDKEESSALKNKLKVIRKLLGGSGASQRCADVILEELKSR